MTARPDRDGGGEGFLQILFPRLLLCTTTPQRKKVTTLQQTQRPEGLLLILFFQDNTEERFVQQNTKKKQFTQQSTKLNFASIELEQCGVEAVKCGESPAFAFSYTVGNIFSFFGHIFVLCLLCVF